jgi:hypothetical protein
LVYALVYAFFGKSILENLKILANSNVKKGKSANVSKWFTGSISKINNVCRGAYGFTGWEGQGTPNCGSSSHEHRLFPTGPDAADFALLTIDTTPNYTDTQPWPTTKTIWTHKANYRADDAQVGRWSQR